MDKPPFSTGAGFRNHPQYEHGLDSSFSHARETRDISGANHDREETQINQRTKWLFYATFIHFQLQTVRFPFWICIPRIGYAYDHLFSLPGHTAYGFKVGARL